MVHKLPALAVLVASLSVACAARNNSPIQAYDLLHQRSRSLYFAANGELVRVYFGARYPLIYIDTLNDPAASGPPRELSPEDPLRAKIEGNFDADLLIKSDGTKFGDDREDEYSPLNQKPRFGKEITSADKTNFSKYLNYIDALLNLESKK